MYLYFVITEEKDGKRFSYVDRLYKGNDLLSFLKRFDESTETIYPCMTKKAAESTVETWNNIQRENGTLLYT